MPPLVPTTRFRQTMLALLLLATTAFAPAANAKDLKSTGTAPVELDFPSAGSVAMDICPSQLTIKGTDKTHLRLTFDTTKSNAAALRIGVNTPTSSNAKIEIEDCPHNGFHITIEVPKTTDLHVRMPAGQLDLKGVTGNKDVELHAGQLEIEVYKITEYAHVEASVLTGQVDAEPWGVNKGGLLRSFSREGPGKYRLHAHVGAGQITFRNAEN